MTAKQLAYPLTAIERAALARLVKMIPAMSGFDQWHIQWLNQHTSIDGINLPLTRHQWLAELAQRYGVMTDESGAAT